MRTREKINTLLLKINFNRTILFLILLIASVVRLYKLGSVPFTHDEFSALFRAIQPNFSDLIKNGVIGDGHPAGIQVILFYLVNTFGLSNFWIKLPFALFGILSIYFIYKIGKLWYNETVGLSSAALISVLQFSVIYSQIARPYVSGLLFCLIATFYWSKYLFKSQKKIDENIIWFVIASIFSSYNHYFSLLFIIILGFTGLFIIKKDRIIYYVSSGIIIFLAFIPHLQITFSAIKMGGLTWLGKPGISFIPDHIIYIFQSSVLIGILVGIIFVSGLIKNFHDQNKNKYRIICLTLFIAPILTGLIYSIFQKPILQHSVLIFSFPFLIIYLMSYLNDFNYKKNALIVTVILGVSLFSLIHEKEHYKTFYKSGFIEILKEQDKISKTIKNDEITTILSSSKGITNYYLRNDSSLFNKHFRNKLITKIDSSEEHLFSLGWSSPGSIVDFGMETNISDYVDFIKNADSEFLFYGWAHILDRNILPVILNYYPYLIESNQFHNAETYLFSKHKSDKKSLIEFSYFNINDFENKYDNWTSSQNICDSIKFSGNHSSFISNDVEFSTTYSSRFNSIHKNKHENILASVKFYSQKEISDTYLVLSIENNKKSVAWYNVNLTDFIDKEKQWQTANLLVQINKIHFPINKKVKIYIWNPNKNEFFIDDLSIKVFDGNKNRYSY